MDSQLAFIGMRIKTKPLTLWSVAHCYTNPVFFFVRPLSGGGVSTSVNQFGTSVNHRKWHLPVSIVPSDLLFFYSQGLLFTLQQPHPVPPASVCLFACISVVMFPRMDALKLYDDNIALARPTRSTQQANHHRNPQRRGL